MKNIYKLLIAIATILLSVILPYYITKEKTDNFLDYIISIPHLSIKLLTYKQPVPIWIILLILGFVVLGNIFFIYFKFKGTKVINNNLDVEDLKNRISSLQSQINSFVKENYEKWKQHSGTATLEFKEDGTAKYTSVREIECLGKNVSTFRESFWVAGNINSFSASPGIVENPEPVENGKVYITRFKKVLKHPDKITRRVIVEIDKNSFNKDTENWEDNHYNDCSNTFFILKTPFRKYHTIRVYHLIHHEKVPIDDKCDIIEEIEGEIVSIKFPDHKIQQKFLIEWTW